MRKYVIPLAVLVTVGVLNWAAFAAEEGEGSDRKGDRAECKKGSKEHRRERMTDEQRAKWRKEMKERLQKRLGLTEDQKKQCDQIMKTHRQALKRGKGAGKEKGARERPHKHKTEHRKKGTDDVVEVKPDAGD